MKSTVYNGRRCGFTLLELTIVCVIVFAVMLFYISPFMRQRGCDGRRATDTDNQKQIALAFLQYLQDYDEQFPPAGSYTHPGNLPVDHSKAQDRPVMQSWGPDRTLPSGEIVSGILSPYTKSNRLFWDPDAKYLVDAPPFLTYMYNDLIAEHRQADLTEASRTVLLADAEDRLANTGHAFTPNSGPFAAQINAQGTCDAGQGASVRAARSQQHGGANFAFADGHVKWFTAGPKDPIFFPARESASAASVDSKTKQRIGPAPDGDMWFAGKSYAGTFQLR